MVHTDASGTVTYTNYADTTPYTTESPGDGTGLQKAISEVQEGETIEMLVPNYTCNIGQTVKTNAITITTADSVGAAATITTNSNADMTLFKLNANKVTLKNLYLKNTGGKAASNTPNKQAIQVPANYGNLTVAACTIDGFRTNGNLHGSAIGAETGSGDVTITDTTIQNCYGYMSIFYASAYGKEHTFTIGGNSVIKDCTSEGWGILVSNHGVSVNITDNTQITGCKLTGKRTEGGRTEPEGAVLCAHPWQGGVFNLSGNVKITGNTGYAASAVENTSGTTTITGNVEISGNTVSRDLTNTSGGAVSSLGSGSLTVGDNVKITGNTYQDSKGNTPERNIYYADSTANPYIKVSSALGDKADIGVTMSNTDKMADGAQFGITTTGASGGGVYAKSDTLTISGTTHFENCSATNFGGGIGANSADVNVDGASFANCSTTSAVDLAGYGGAIRAGLGNSKIKIKNTTITGCHAKVGGALSVETAQTTLDTITITGNNYCDDANQAIVHCKDASLAIEGATTITGNKPTSDGKTCSYVVGSDGACQITLGDTTSITGNQFTGGRTGSSAVFMNSASTLSVSGGVQVTGNTDGAAEKNVYLTGSSNNIQVTGDLTDTANIGVTMETEARKAAGQQFGVTTAKPASEVAKLDHLYQDGNTAYVGTAGTDTAVVWKYEPEVCRNQQTQSVYKGDDALVKAVAAAASGDTIEMLVAQYTVPAQIEVDKDLTITKAAGIDSATLTLSTDFKNGTDMFAVSGDGKTFTLKDMALTSSAPNSRAITQNKGTVALKNTTVSGFERTGNIYGGAVSVTTGTFTMDRSTINACSTASYAGAIQSAKG